LSKELNTKVKTVLQGEVLKPGDEGYEPREKAEEGAEVWFDYHGATNTAYGYGAPFSVNDAQNYNGGYPPPNSAYGEQMMRDYISVALAARQRGNFGCMSNNYGCCQHRPGLFFPCRACGRR